jgi:hypothetical protein
MSAKLAFTLWNLKALFVIFAQAILIVTVVQISSLTQDIGELIEQA